MELFNSLGEILFPILMAFTVVSFTLLIAAWLVTSSMSHRSAANRFSVWQLCIAAMLLVPFGTAFLPGIPLGMFQSLETANTSKTVTLSFEKPFELQSINTAGEAMAPFADGTLTQRRRVDRIAEPADWTRPFAERETLNVRPEVNNAEDSVAQTNVASDERSENSISSALPSVAFASICVAIWLAGTFYFFGRMFVSLRIAKRIKDGSSNVHGSAFAGSPVVPNHIALRTSETLRIPVTLGTIHPVIVLPAEAKSWSADRVNWVMQHELAHINRRDIAWQWLTKVVRAMIWFQPMIWFAERTMELERERACDDQVIRNGASTVGYAKLLVSYAESLSQEHLLTNRAGLLSMAQPPLERRLKTILDLAAPRSSSSLLLQLGWASVMSLVAVSASVVQPFEAIPKPAKLPKSLIAGLSGDTELSNIHEPQEPAVQNNDQALPTEIQLPKMLGGKIMDVAGKPIVGATVELSISYQPRGRGHAKALPILTTNADGEFSFETSIIDRTVDLVSISGFVKKPGFIDYRHSFTTGTAAVYRNRTQKFHDAVMFDGRKVSGKIVGPSGRQAKAIWASFRAETAASFTTWNSAPIRCADDGRFDAYIPKHGLIELVAGSENFAETTIEVDAVTENLGEVALQEGTSVHGKVMDADGRPVPGIVVVIDGKASKAGVPNAYSQTPSFRFATTTSAKGEYRLPPCIGPARLYLEAYSWSKVRGRFLVSSDNMPIANPIVLQLDPSKVSQEVDLIGVKETIDISGNVRWSDGQPAKNVEVTGLVMVETSGIDISRATTDDKGNYRLKMPAASNGYQSCVSTHGQMRDDGVHGYSRHDISNEKTLTQANAGASRQIVSLTDMSEDIEDFNWLLEIKKPDPIGHKNPTVKKVSAKRSTERVSKFLLGDLLADHHRIQIKLAKELKDAKADIDRFMAEQSLKAHQGNLENELLEFEAKYRGDTAAFDAVKQLIRLDAKRPGGLTEPSAAMQRLLDHYMDFEDLDFFLDDLANSTMMQFEPDFFPLFDEVAEHSKHRHVQASALFYHCGMLTSGLNQRQASAEMNWMYEVHSGSGKKAQRIQYEKTKPADEQASFGLFLKMISKIEALDDDETRAKILQLAKRIEEDFSDVTETQRAYFLNGSRISSSYFRHTAKDSKTYAEKLIALHFQLNQVQPGKPFPDFEYDNWNGDSFSMKQLKGKVVLLIFDDYPTTRYSELKSRFAGQPFEIVSVMVEPLASLDALKDSEKGKAIDWTVIPDPNREIVSQWGIAGYPPCIVIDKHGIIAKKLTDLQPLGDAVAAVLKQK